MSSEPALPSPRPGRIGVGDATTISPASPGSSRSPGATPDTALMVSLPRVAAGRTRGVARQPDDPVRRGERRDSRQHHPDGDGEARGRPGEPPALSLFTTPPRPAASPCAASTCISVADAGLITDRGEGPHAGAVPVYTQAPARRRGDGWGRSDTAQVIASLRRRTTPSSPRTGCRPSPWRCFVRQALELVDVRQRSDIP